jgi:hypothetical protein
MVALQRLPLHASRLPVCLAIGSHSGAQEAFDPSPALPKPQSRRWWGRGLGRQYGRTLVDELAHQY